MKLFPAACVIVGGAIAAAVQQPRFTSTGALVRLEVSATDDRGNVRGLQAADFVVTDNGIRQTVRVDEFADAPLDLEVVAQPTAALNVTSAAQASRMPAGLAEVIRRIEDRDRFGAIVAGAPPRRLRALELGRPAFDAAAFADGSDAAPFDAIAAALPEFQESDRHRALVVFTNGVDFRSTVTTDALTRAARRLGPAFILVASPVRVEDPTYVRAVTTSGVQLGEATAMTSGWVFPQALERLARTTGGFTVDLGAGDPAKIIEDLFQRLRTRYVLSYEPPAGKGWHPVSIKVNRRGVNVGAREGYFVD
jgi:hypothetical protein